MPGNPKPDNMPPVHSVFLTSHVLEIHVATDIQRGG
jgi:hypothetical protein